MIQGWPKGYKKTTSESSFRIFLHVIAKAIKLDMSKSKNSEPTNMVEMNMN
jgi:hypothetical protein